MEWKDYFNDRMIAKDESGFYVIKPKNCSENSVPVFCPICEKIMNSSFDEETYGRFSCCDDCANKHVYKDIDRWKSGWRPGKDLINKD
jgi:hypothetical protein